MNIVIDRDWNWNSAFAPQLKTVVFCFLSSWNVSENELLFVLLINKLSKVQKNIVMHEKA